MIKEGKILKGIKNFKLDKSNPNQRFITIAKMVDNNILYILATILLILLSIFSIQGKKNIYMWSAANWENKVFLSTQQ
jgi:hypothetical protein